MNWTLFTERRNEAAQVSFVDGYENRKMFCVSDLHLENEAKTNAMWNFITEKNIHVVIMSEINEASKNIKLNIAF